MNTALHARLGALIQSGQYQDAEAAAQAALGLEPQDGITWKALGVAQKLQGKDAFAALQKSAELLPGDAEAQFNLGVVLQDRGDHANAIAQLERAVSLNPGHAKAWNNLGSTLRKTNRLPVAIKAFAQAIALLPEFAEAHHNLGVALEESGDFAGAVKSHQAAIRFNPGYARPYLQIGRILHHAGRAAEAVDYYRKSISLDQTLPDSQYNLALALLALGHYQEGFSHYEARFHKDLPNSIPLPDTPLPRWRGGSLKGRKIALHAEQGLGDAIQFARFAKLLDADGVSMICHAKLETLLAGVEGISKTGQQTGQAESADCYAMLMSLPHALGMTIDSLPRERYIHASRELTLHWRERLPAGFKVGIAWKGNPKYHADAHRSLPGLASLAPLWNIPDVTFFSLQHEMNAEDARLASSTLPVIPIGSEASDFANLAAIIESLDCVITVDSVFAHLAGAMHKPCFVLLSKTGCDWRWTLDHADSAWYPTARLFRQSAAGDWGSVINDVKLALESLQRHGKVQG